GSAKTAMRFVMRHAVTLASAVALLLLSLTFGANGLGANNVVAAPKIGANSCQGQDACTGLTAHVGNSSCNGFQACLNGSRNVGDGSCNGDEACAFNSGTVGDASCSDNFSCFSNSGSVGNGS